MAWYRSNCTANAVLPISALESRGLDAVRDWIQKQLPESPSLYPKVCVRVGRQRWRTHALLRLPRPSLVLLLLPGVTCVAACGGAGLSL